MIWACISSSSPVASFAIFEDEAVLASGQKAAPMAASGALLEMLSDAFEQLGLAHEHIEIWAADVGPGSFTGVKVAVTMAKSFAYALGKRAAGISSFELISGDNVSAIPSRKHKYLLSTLEEVDDTDERLRAAIGYGDFFEEQRYPQAANAANYFSKLRIVNAFELLPNYVLEPSISKPKTPYKESI